MKISNNKFVACSYDLYAGKDNERELKEQATKEKPLEFIQGMGMMIPAFENNLVGLSVGDKFDFEIIKNDAYGDVVADAIVELPKNIFQNAEGVFDEEIVFEGNWVPMRDSEGHDLQGLVKEVSEDTVLMDFNHPLAGMNLHFIGEILDVHNPTEKEMQTFFGSRSGSCCCGGCNKEEDHNACGCGHKENSCGCRS